jgi:hypothetical protein
MHLETSWGPLCLEGDGFTPEDSYSSVGLYHFISEMDRGCMKYGISPIQFVVVIKMVVCI